MSTTERSLAVMRRAKRQADKKRLAIAAMGVWGGQYVICHRCKNHTVTLYDSKGGFTAVCRCGNRAAYTKRGQVASVKAACSGDST